MLMKKTVEEYFSLKGRVAVVTGGGGELCGCMAEALGALGVRVAVLDLEPAKAQKRVEAIRRDGGIAEAFACSVLEEAELRRVYEKVCSLWGTPDYLINGAGGNDPRGSTDVEFLERADLDRGDRDRIKSFLGLELAGFRGTFELNFLGTSLPTRVFAEGMVRKGKGSILNLSSINALAPLTKIPAYSAAKAAVANFTRWLAVDLARRYGDKVRVNAVAPGFFVTTQNRAVLVNPDGSLTPRARRVVDHTPMGRFGRPDELFGAVQWLCSDAASFVTGVVIPVDGGFSAFSGV
jgi:NAD(P)-dependent dehydrogenase (short-subunit alcohol dehydrogenase family)